MFFFFFCKFRFGNSGSHSNYYVNLVITNCTARFYLNIFINNYFSLIYFSAILTEISIFLKLKFNYTYKNTPTIILQITILYNLQ